MRMRVQLEVVLAVDPVMAGGRGISDREIANLIQVSLDLSPFPYQDDEAVEIRESRVEHFSRILSKKRYQRAQAQEDKP